MFATKPEDQGEELLKMEKKIQDLIRDIVAQVASKESVVIAVPIQEALILPYLVGENIENIEKE